MPLARPPAASLHLGLQLHLRLGERRLHLGLRLSLSLRLRLGWRLSLHLRLGLRLWLGTDLLGRRPRPRCPRCLWRPPRLLRLRRTLRLRRPVRRRGRWPGRWG
ncbi:MAG: hypothetical protein JO242_28630 [Streptosporangiaceae bacterium]|nr:hypothetical protein [Streptosporangiaceae bacterium]